MIAKRIQWIIPLLLVGFFIALIHFERGNGFEYDRTTGPRSIYERVFKKAGIQEVGVCLCAPDKEIRLRLPGGFETIASLYDRGENGLRPGIVFVHGNTWQGRNLSTYRFLANLLAELGYVVLTYDQLGFGQSDDPFGKGPSNVAIAYDRAAAASAAVDYLVQNTIVDTDRISIFGHSGGVDTAIYLGLLRQDIANIFVMPAPPTPPKGDADKHAKKRSQYFSKRMRDQYRFVYNREVPDWYTWDLTGRDAFWREYRQKTAVLKTSGHKPFILLLGEFDNPSGHPKIKNEFEQLGEPKKLIILRRAGHYLNTAQLLGLIFYDRAVADQLINELR